MPETQLCCGALHAHSGEKKKAKALAKQNIEAFESLQVDAMVVNIGGCGAFLNDDQHLLKDDEKRSERAHRFANKLKNLSSLLLELDFSAKPLFLPNRWPLIRILAICAMF